MKNLKEVSLPEEYTVVYSLPDRGAVFLLTPSAEGPGHSAREIDERPELIEGRVLAKLKVVQQLHPDLPPDDYVITLAPDGNNLIFTGEEATAKFWALICELPEALPQPTALITTSLMGLAWEKTQICGWVDTRLPDDLSKRLEEAIQNLQKAGILEAGGEAFALNRAVPSVEGQDALERWQEAVSQENYAESRATVLAAPAAKDGAFPAPPEKGEIIGIGLLVALTDIAGSLYHDLELEQPANVLPAGDYLIFEVRLDNGRQTTEGIYEARGRLSGPAGDFYVPIVGGSVVIGTARRGTAPSGEDEAIILNLKVRSRCSLKIRSRCKLG